MPPNNHQRSRLKKPAKKKAVPLRTKNPVPTKKLPLRHKAPHTLDKGVRTSPRRRKTRAV